MRIWDILRSVIFHFILKKYLSDFIFFLFLELFINFQDI